MTNLSPAAKSVAEAFEEAWRMTPEADPYECCVSPVAAALRAAADQVVPEQPHEDTFEYCCDYAQSKTKDAIRHQLLAIATELEGAGD